MSIISPAVIPSISRRMMKGVLSVMRPSEIEVRRCPGVRGEVGAYCKEKGYRKVLVVTGPIVGKMEIAQKLYEGLDTTGIQHVTFDGIQPEPLFSGCKAGSEAAKQNQVDAIIAFGGGSVMDSAKIIAATMAYPNSSFNRFEIPFTAFRHFPLITIPTTAGTGCEVTFGSIVCDDKTRTKKNIGGPGYTPEICFLDVETTENLPAELTATIGMDALAHLTENYLATAGSAEVKKMCEEGVRNVLEFLPRAYQNGASDREAREKMMESAYRGGIAINASGAVYGHALAHAIGGIYHIPHGQICGTILPEVLRYYREPCAEQLARLAVACGLGTAEEAPKLLAGRLVDRVSALRDTLNLPHTIKGMRRNDLDAVKKEFWKQALLFPAPATIREADLARILDRLAED